MSPDCVRLSIGDDGVGFEPIQVSASRGRHGWGLGIMAERAAAVAGRFRIEARPGHGTRVKVEVPRATASRFSPPPMGPVPAPAVSSRRVLVVDDDPRVRGSAIPLLRAARHTVVEADSRAAGIAR